MHRGVEQYLNNEGTLTGQSMELIGQSSRLYAQREQSVRLLRCRSRTRQELQMRTKVQAGKLFVLTVIVLFRSGVPEGQVLISAVPGIHRGSCTTATAASPEMGSGARGADNGEDVVVSEKAAKKLIIATTCTDMGGGRTRRWDTGTEIQKIHGVWGERRRWSVRKVSDMNKRIMHRSRTVCVLSV